jgi:hypothetical protein
MENKIIVEIILVLIVLPVISADSIMPGQKTITVHNYVTNIHDFPDYVLVIFVSEQGLCSLYIETINESGEVPNFHKNCQGTIYAVEKTEANLEILERIEARENGHLIEDLFASLPKKEVIENVISYKQIPDSMSLKEEHRYYSIDIEQVKEKPDKIERTGGYLKEILYALLSLTALIMIIMTISRGRQ